MAGSERDVLARAAVRMREANVGEGTLTLCLAIVRSEMEAARGYTLTRSAPDTPPDGLQPDGHTIVHVAACEGCFGPGGYQPPETVLDDLTEPVPVDMTGVPRREPAGSEPGQGVVTGSVSVAPLCDSVMAACQNEPDHPGDHWNPALAAQPSAPSDASREPGTCIHAAGCICRDPGHDQCCAAQPSAEPGLREAAIGLLIAVDNAALDALVDSEDGAEVPDWQERLWDAADVARAAITPAALAPDRPTPGEATARCGNCQHDADIHSPVNAELCAVPGCSCPGYLTVSR